MLKHAWWLCLGMWLGAAHAVTVTDDRNVSLTLVKAPQRIVTLLPSLAETVCVLGACDRLVGTDRYANWPAPVQALPKLGGLDDLHIEALVRLKPDLVLLARSTRATARLSALGIPVLALEPQNQADVKRVVQVVAQALMLPDATARADAVWQRVEVSLAQAQQRVPHAARGQSVYFEASTGGYAAGESSFIGELLTGLGLRNIVPATLGPFPQINPEFVVRANPQLIFMGEPSAQDVAARPGWSRLDAVRQQRVCALTPAQGDVLVRPGPRLAEAVEVLLQCLKRSYPA